MIPVAKSNLDGNELKYITEAIKTNWISSKGKFVEEFENEFANYCKTKYAISTTSCTTALHLALMAIEIKSGDEVIVPNLTFATTANVVKYCGGKEILVDVKIGTYNIDPDKIEEKITINTKAIIVVHLYGYPCQMDKILAIAKKHKLYIIEDVAEAQGAFYDEKMVGSIGDIGCFSFFGNKIMTTGEGGMCVTNNKDLYDKILVLKNHGMAPNKGYWHDVVGYNYRMTNLQAGIGLAQLERINSFIEKRDMIAKWYIENLKKIDGIEFQEEIVNSKKVCWMFSITLNNKFKLNVERLIEILKNNQIDTRRMFFPLNEMPPYKDNSKFPNSKYLYENTLVLPTFYDLTKEEIVKICEIIKNAK